MDRWCALSLVPSVLCHQSCAISLVRRVLCAKVQGAGCRVQPCASMPRPHPNPTRRAGTRSTRCGGCCRGMADPSMAGRRCAACVSSTWTSRCESRATLAAASSCTRDRWPHPREGRGATSLKGASFGAVVKGGEEHFRHFGTRTSRDTFYPPAKLVLDRWAGTRVPGWKLARVAIVERALSTRA